MNKYYWKDIVKIKDFISSECFQISGKFDIVNGKKFYQLDDFYNSLMEKYNCEYDDIELWTDTHFSFTENSNILKFDLFDCGVYIEEENDNELSLENLYEITKTRYEMSKNSTETEYYKNLLRVFEKWI